jgi:hypothetical protein
MFDFFYNHLTANCPSKFDMGMSDTDSFLFSVTKPKQFWSHVDKYIDYSNYPETHPNFNETNKAALGFFKNELAGSKICSEFIGLRAKCYSLKLKDANTSCISEKNVCKGLGRVAIKNRLKFKQYKTCLKKLKVKRHEFASIRSVKHKLATIRQKKRALSHFDSKRWIYDCGIHSDPYGSKFIKKYYEKCHYC